jgi:hypothetical protein
VHNEAAVRASSARSSAACNALQQLIATPTSLMIRGYGYYARYNVRSITVRSQFNGFIDSELDASMPYLGNSATNAGLTTSSSISTEYRVLNYELLSITI